MATTQLHRTQSKTWEALFPNEQVTQQKSCLFVKKLLAVAISNITYLRNIFPEHAFGDKSLEDLNLKILRDESSCPGACQVIKWVKGCFDALDKKYLKSLVIGIYVDPEKPETVIESYLFKFSYNDNGEIDIFRNNKKISSAYSEDDTKNATIRLLRTLIILTNTLNSLPHDVMMTMKLFYYDEVTPADYEPPGFKSSEHDGFVFAEEATNIAVGEVSTPFHNVKLRVKTSSKQFEEKEPAEENEGMPVSNSSLDVSQTDNKENLNQAPNTGVAPRSTDREEKTTMECESAMTRNSIASPGKAEDNVDEFKVRCPCGCNEDDGLMVMCSNCNFWQHGICFLITNEDKAPSNHICDVCAKIGTPGLEPTDPHLCELSSIAVQGTCLWRRAITAVTEFKSVVAPQLAKRLGVETAVAQGLINRLEKEDFLHSTKKGKRFGKTVDKRKILSEGIPKYLKTPQTLSKKSQEGECEMNDAPANEFSDDKGKEDSRQSVDALVDQTSKIHLNEGGQKLRKSPAQTLLEKIPVGLDTKGRRGRKRAYSKADNAEFEIVNSQEMQPRSKKKASTVQRDIAV